MLTDYTAGILWALLSAIFFSVSAVLISIYLRRMGVLAASFVTNIVNAAVLAAIGGALFDASRLSLEGFVWFSILGVTAFSAGRFIYNQGISTVGPSRHVTVASLAPFISLLLGVILLGERPGPAVIGGTVLVVAGVALVTYEPSEGSWFHKGILWSFASAFSFAISMFMRKKGLAAMPDVYLTVAWSNLVGLPILWGSRPFVSARLWAWGDRRALAGVAVVGVLNAFAQVFTNAAVEKSSISVVTPIITTTPLFTLFFTLLLLRGHERIRPLATAGVLVTVAGVLSIAIWRG